VLENMTQFAIGFENGVVMLLRGDVSRDRFTKQKIIHEGSSSITGMRSRLLLTCFFFDFNSFKKGLGFHEDGKSTALYIVTLAEILVVDTTGKDFKVRKEHLPSF
jgi:hypothetical protein